MDWGNLYDCSSGEDITIFWSQIYLLAGENYWLLTSAMAENIKYKGISFGLLSRAMSENIEYMVIGNVSKDDDIVNFCG